jgi:preprotein translocase subunit Sec61beta
MIDMNIDIAPAYTEYVTIAVIIILAFAWIKSGR